MNLWFNRIYALIHKEILAVWRDKKSRIVLIIPPLTQLLIFAFAATLDVKNVPIGILNRDNGEQGIELVQRFRGSPMFTDITYLYSVEEIAPFIDNQKGVMVLSIDEQFSRNLDAKKNAQIQLILDGRKSNTAQILAGYSSEIVSQFSSDVARRIGIETKKAELVPRNWFNPNLIYYWFNVPGLCGILTMVVGLVVTALSIARERELGTFDQLLVSPLKPYEILIGKTVPGIIIAMAEGTLIVLVAIFVFQIPFTGSMPLFYLSMLIYTMAIVGFGLFISSLCNTQQQAILGGFLLMSPSVLLSGFATPIANMPEWLQTITYAFPLRYFLVICRGSFLRGMTPEDVLSNTWPMLIIAIVTLTSAAWFFRRRLE